MPSCLQACLTTGWTCHRDQPLQIQTQNRDTIDSSSSPCMLVSSRTAHHALTKSWRNKFSKYEFMAIRSGLSSQIVCGPGVFSPPFRLTFWCLFWVWGPSGTPWFPALNLTGIWTSILTYFRVTFRIFCRCYFQGFFALFPDLLLLNFY